jgi:hypothetical protein
VGHDLYSGFSPRHAHTLCVAAHCLPAAADVPRSFNVFLPAGFRYNRRYPVWMHIHGVYWGSMDGISSRLGWNVLARDATAAWDGIVGSDKVYNSAIVVYLQSTPSPYTNPDQRMVRHGQACPGTLLLYSSSFRMRTHWRAHIRRFTSHLFSQMCMKSHLAFHLCSA